MTGPVDSVRLARVMNRRQVLIALLAAPLGTAKVHSMAHEFPRPVDEAVDHIILGAPTLETGIEFVADTFGIRPALGGTHPGRGTHNALVGLAGRRYLEVIAPVPGAEGSGPLFEAVRGLRQPSVVWWALEENDSIDDLRPRAFGAGLEPGDIVAGSRTTPEGCELRWETMGFGKTYDRMIPFAINWLSRDDHPSLTAPKGLRLTAFWFEHPKSIEVRDSLAAINVVARVVQLDVPRLRVRIVGPKGEVEI